MELEPRGILHSDKTWNLIWKIFFLFDLRILPQQIHIGDRIFPCRCILIKKKDDSASVAVRYNKSISIIETVISIDYRYIDFLASYFSDRSRGIDRVGDNWRTVNTSANPHISDQLTELENRIHVLNTVMLIYRHDMSCGLQ